jgi:hypothetical protein
MKLPRPFISAISHFGDGFVDYSNEEALAALQTGGVSSGSESSAPASDFFESLADTFPHLDRDVLKDLCESFDDPDECFDYVAKNRNVLTKARPEELADPHLDLEESQGTLPSESVDCMADSKVGSKENGNPFRTNKG